MPTELEPILILADARRLAEGQGLRFAVRLEGIERDAFAVRWRGAVHAFLNACRHQHRNLDFGDAHYFDDAYDAVVCCHHGARYRPDSGVCFEGPCRGRRLTRLVIEERAGGLWCVGAVPAPRVDRDGPSGRQDRL
jgi:nitrite reductase/ring-hydroxylating ferredoxin subunit